MDTKYGREFSSFTELQTMTSKFVVNFFGCSGGSAEPLNLK